MCESVSFRAPWSINKQRSGGFGRKLFAFFVNTAIVYSPGLVLGYKDDGLCWMFVYWVQAV